jgi:hypothetical protein
VRLRDNFLKLTIDGETVQAAAEVGLPQFESFLQGLSVLYGQIFSANLLSAEDESGNPKSFQLGPRKLELFKTTVYNFADLQKKVEKAAYWATHGDAAARKALFYSEHAALLRQFSETLPVDSPHASFSRALAFLQLFKALTALVGDPSSDPDYQSRFRRLGLPSDFWLSRAKPLYNVRNDEDVAHYSHAMPKNMDFYQQYGDAMAIFREALDAYVKWCEGPDVR